MEVPRLRFVALFALLWLPLMAQDAVPSNPFAGNYDWSRNPEYYPGIRHAYMEASTPRIMKIHAVAIQVDDAKHGFCVTKADPEAGKPMPEDPKLTIRTRRQKTREFMREVRKPVADGGRGLNLVVAANTTPWVPWCAPWNQKYADKQGLIVSDGELVCPAKGTPSLLVYKDGHLDIQNTPVDFDISQVAQAVSGFAICLKDGKAISSDKACHPRTGYGLSADRKTLIIITIDGRQPNYSMGATVAEVGECLRYFGADLGANMDGGGSTTLVFWLPDFQRIVQANHQGGDAERTVGCNFGVYLK